VHWRFSSHREGRNESIGAITLPESRFYVQVNWICKTLADFWGVPITVFSFSVFLKPLMQDFHARRAAVSLAFTLHLIVAAFGAPSAGWLIGRYGARKVI
jgi:MFS family permease